MPSFHADYEVRTVPFLPWREADPSFDVLIGVGVTGAPAGRLSIRYPSTTPPIDTSD